MTKLVKNRAQLTAQQKEVINQIIIIISARIYNYVKSVSPAEYGKRFLKFPKSKENLAYVFLRLNLNDMTDSGRLHYPSDLNQRLAMKFANEGRRYLKGSALRKILKILVNQGLLFNLRGKRDIKQKARYAIHKERKGGEYTNSKREGNYSMYETTPNAQLILKTLSYPGTTQIITSRLQKLDLINKFFELLILGIMHAVRNSDKHTKNLLLNGLEATNAMRSDSPNLNDSDLQQFIDISNKLDENKLKEIAKQIAQNMTDASLLEIVYQLFALPKL
jgi:hypothetical protein